MFDRDVFENISIGYVIISFIRYRKRDCYARKTLTTAHSRKKTQLDALRPLPAAAVRRLNEQLTIEWIYNSNAIEGSTLSLRETQLILEQGITIGGKSLREHFEVINHQEAIKLVELLVGKQDPLTAFDVR